MDIGKLYETLTGEAYPYAPDRFVEASWALSNRASMLTSLPSEYERIARRSPGRKPGQPKAS